jgi:hypothetical protein
VFNRTNCHPHIVAVSVNQRQKGMRQLCPRKAARGQPLNADGAGLFGSVRRDLCASSAFLTLSRNLFNSFN